MSRDLRVVGAVGPRTITQLAYATRLDTLEEVLHRGLELLDVIVQDEYTHDVVCRAPEGFVVFDTT